MGRNQEAELQNCARATAYDFHEIDRSYRLVDYWPGVSCVAVIGTHVANGRHEMVALMNQLQAHGYPVGVGYVVDDATFIALIPGSEADSAGVLAAYKAVNLADPRHLVVWSSS